MLLWAAYGVVWACAEGSFKMTVDQEVIVYAVLDITAKCVFGFVLLFSREAIARYGSFLGGVSCCGRARLRWRCPTRWSPCRGRARGLPSNWPRAETRMLPRLLRREPPDSQAHAYLVAAPARHYQ